MTDEFDEAFKNIIQSNGMEDIAEALQAPTNLELSETLGSLGEAGLYISSFLSSQFDDDTDNDFMSMDSARAFREMSAAIERFCAMICTEVDDDDEDDEEDDDSGNGS